MGRRWGKWSVKKTFLGGKGALGTQEGVEKGGREGSHAMGCYVTSPDLSLTSTILVHHIGSCSQFIFGPISD